MREMPIFKGANGKENAVTAIEYVTRPGKAAIYGGVNLVEGFDYALQFRITAKKYGKWDDGGRRYYHYKLSPDPRDEIEPETMQAYALDVASDIFAGHETVVATHTDTKIIHAHLVTNAVSKESGRKLRVTKSDYRDFISRANEIGLKYGLTPSNFGKKKAEVRYKSTELQIQKRGGFSWKIDLREKIENALEEAGDREEFEALLLTEGVKTEYDAKRDDYSYFHPQAEGGIYGRSLGEKYTVSGIEAALKGGGG